MTSGWPAEAKDRPAPCPPLLLFLTMGVCLVQASVCCANFTGQKIRAVYGVRGTSELQSAAQTMASLREKKLPAIVDGEFFEITHSDGNKFCAKCKLCPLGKRSLSSQYDATSNLTKHLKVSERLVSFFRRIIFRTVVLVCLQNYNLNVYEALRGT